MTEALDSKYRCPKTLSSELNKSTTKMVVKWKVGLVTYEYAYATQQLLMPFTVLKFVACGERGLEGFSFKEIYSIYNMHVWICILASFIFIQLLFAMFTSKRLFAKPLFRISIT